MKKSLLLILVFLCIPVAYSADVLVVNSADWRDVYSSLQYGKLIEENSQFLVSDRHSTLILNAIPKRFSVRVISSAEEPFVIGYPSIIQNAGFAEVEEQTYSNANLELAELVDVTNFIIVDDSYGYNAISVAPYAAVSESYVLFADRTNIADVVNYLNSRPTIDNLLIYGNVDRQVRAALTPFNPEIINNDGDRFANNIEIVKKYREINPAKQVLLTNGEFIEKEILSGNEPVVFIGSNNVPDQIREYIQSTDISIGVLVGNELVGTATTIRRQVGISVFVKFAQGARAPEGAISQVEALDMFYLPVYALNIEVESVTYNRATNQLEIGIRNTEEQAVYFKGTYTIKESDGSEQTVGDLDAVFLDGDELKTLVYDVEPLPDGKSGAEIFIIYGESRGSMEQTLDTELEIEIVEVLDNCVISLTSLEYDKRSNEFIVGVENTGEVDCYVDLEIVDVIIDAIPQDVSADDVMLVKAGKKGKQKIDADLTDEDIEENSNVKVRGFYGEREESLVKIIEAEFEMKLKGIDFVFYGLLLVIIILIILILWKRRKDKKEED